jgi:DnaK suppressor protein
MQAFNLSDFRPLQPDGGNKAKSNNAYSTKVADLEADRQRISDEIARLEQQLRTRIDPDIDEADPNLSNQVTLVALLKNARQKAIAIDHALSQARGGGYGICEDCGQPIDPERLEIFPQATLCVPCKSAREQPGHYRRAA